MTPQRLTLDFVAPPPARRNGRLLLGIGMVALLVGGAQLALAWQEHQRERADLASLDRQGNAGGRARAVAANPGALRAAASIARDLSAPWPELMRAMEAIRSADVSLVRVEPIAARGSLRITADARHPDAMLDYLQQMKAQGLADVVLTSHQLQDKQPGTPIRFQAQARWSDITARPAQSSGPDPIPLKSAQADVDTRAMDRFIENARGAR